MPLKALGGGAGAKGAFAKSVSGSTMIQVHNLNMWIGMML